MPLPASF